MKTNILSASSVEIPSVKWTFLIFFVLSAVVRLRNLKDFMTGTQNSEMRTIEKRVGGENKEGWEMGTFYTLPVKRKF
ncbi:MAG: hypothetical protein U9R43_00075 [Thermodesulfobacteriota bacterium]|nr:hypothetical protein [Thermodesulfobacteriota bacterium]